MASPLASLGSASLSPTCHSASAVWYSGLGSARSPVDGQEYAPTLAMAQLSNTNWGRVLSNRTAELLHANKPIEIHILGGSVSVAAYVMTGAFKKRGEWHPDNPLVGTSMRHGNSNSENAWPAMVEAALSGCLGAGMARVINHAERAVGTDVWVDRMASNSVNLSSADVILIEEASNDAEQYTVQAAGGGGGKSGFTGESSAAGFTEVLLHQLKALPKQPFLMWVTAAWKDFEYGRAHSAEAEHLSILRRYDVPHLSVLQAVTPPIDATTETKDAITRFLYRIYFADCCHPTRTGHKIIAALVVRRLLLQLVETPSRSWFVSSSEDGSSAPSIPDPHLQVGSMRHSYQMGEDAFVTSRARTMVPILFREGAPTPLRISWYAQGSDPTPPPPSPNLVSSLSWGANFSKFGQNKHALVMSEVGSRIVLNVPTQSRWALVGLLHSYHSTGIARVAVIDLQHHRGGGSSSSSLDVAFGCRPAALSAALEKARLSEVYADDAPGGAVDANLRQDGETCGGSSKVGTWLGSNGHVIVACTRIDLLWKMTISVRRSVHLPLPAAAKGTACRWLVVATAKWRSPSRPPGSVTLHDLTVL